MNSSPKKLSIREIWELHRTLNLRHKSKDYLADELDEILNEIDVMTFEDSLMVMYGKGFKIDQSPAKLLLMFIKGIKKSEYFSFRYFIGTFQRGN